MLTVLGGLAEFEREHPPQSLVTGGRTLAFSWETSAKANPTVPAALQASIEPE
jgi:hypothetical protein